jgi:hypothetical protein
VEKPVEKCAVLIKKHRMGFGKGDTVEEVLVFVSVHVPVFRFKTSILKGPKIGDVLIGIEAIKEREVCRNLRTIVSEMVVKDVFTLLESRGTAGKKESAEG